MQTLLRSDARHIEMIRQKQALLDPTQSFFVQPIAVQASPTGYNIFVFEQGRPLSLIKNVVRWPKDTTCILEGLSQVMRGLNLLHTSFGSHNNVTINTVSAKEPPNECLPNVKIQLVGHSFFASPWAADFKSVHKAQFQEASAYLGTQSVLPMIALTKYLDSGLDGLAEQLAFAENYPSYTANRSKWSLSNQDILWPADKCMRAIKYLDELQDQNPTEASKAIRCALSFGDVFQFQRLCLEWVPTVFQRLETNLHINMLELNLLHSQLKAFFEKMNAQVEDELVMTQAKHAPWNQWISEFTSIFAKYVFTNDIQSNK